MHSMLVTDNGLALMAADTLELHGVFVRRQHLGSRCNLRYEAEAVRLLGQAH